MNIKDIIQLSIIGLISLVIVVYCVIMCIKNHWISSLYDTLKIAIKEAEEKFPESGSGDKKKTYVLEKIKEKTKELGIPYSLVKNLIIKSINTIISNYNILKK